MYGACKQVLQGEDMIQPFPDRCQLRVTLATEPSLTGMRSQWAMNWRCTVFEPCQKAWHIVPRKEFDASIEICVLSRTKRDDVCEAQWFKISGDRKSRASV
ncbi:hypothetical protein KIN20_033298 [Parelaphostrongylus tenuis]|uniref:Uncharacterized protein n=1 Tax=Parelaphostrongylus tenuis TaxID=148309 RepID=A0AAD5R880_PARTN|nr:hypothetical protein KIN20_033298 [Parelaphostrongylus tenuis]